MHRSVFAAVAVFVALALPSAAQARTWDVASDTTNPGARLTHALQNAQNGDRIHIQAPGPYVAPSGGWKIRRSIELYGDGAGRAAFQDGRSSTVLMPRSNNDPVLVVDVGEVPERQSLWNVYVHDLQIAQDVKVPAPPRPASNGVFLKITEKKSVTDLRLERLFIYGMGNDGIHLEGKGGDDIPMRVSVVDCHSAFNSRHGLLALYVNMLQVQGGAYDGNWNKGAQIQGCTAAHVLDAVFESNQKGGAKPDSLAPSQLFLEGSGAFQVRGCHFEGFVNNDNTGVRTAVAINSPSGYIGDCQFHGRASTPGSIGIYVGWSSQSVVIGTNNWDYVDKLVEVADLPTTKSCTVMPQSVAYSTGVASQIVVPDAPDRGHLIVASTSNTSNVTAGWVLPRITQGVRNGMKPTAAGGTLRKGLLVFNETTHKLNYWDGKEWRELVDAPASP